MFCGLPVRSGKKFMKKYCCIYGKGSSGLMEVERSIAMFLWSTEKFNLRYVTYVGHCDFSAFEAVKKAVEEKFGDQCPLHKKDCIGHIKKGMGTALHNYKNKS